MLELIPNRSTDFAPLARMIDSAEELSLVWPEARYPFDAQQWRDRFSSPMGGVSYYLHQGEEHTGHGALMETDDADMKTLSYLLISTKFRGNGLGRWLLGLLENEAIRAFNAKCLQLRVRSFNHNALHLYQSFGFVKVKQDGTLIIMQKSIVP